MWLVEHIGMPIGEFGARILLYNLELTCCVIAGFLICLSIYACIQANKGA